MTIYTFGANLVASEILVTLMVCFSRERFADFFCYVIVSVMIFILASAVTACIVIDFNGVFGAIFIAWIVFFYMSLKLVVLVMMYNSVALDNDQYGFGLVKHHTNVVGYFFCALSALG